MQGGLKLLGKVFDPEKNAQEKIETFGDLVSQIQAFVKN